MKHTSKNNMKNTISSKKIKQKHSKQKIPNNKKKTKTNDSHFSTKTGTKSRSKPQDKNMNNIKYIKKIHKDKNNLEDKFIQNFLSFQTPYNSLLLFHGLGTGKTCSAITVCEETRKYLKQLGINKKIIFVAAPNIQDNFKLQLFDERKLKLLNGFWDIKSCVGNKFIKEINPMNMKGLDRNTVIKQIKKIISESYEFYGYVEFSKYINKIMAKVGNLKAMSQGKFKRQLFIHYKNTLIPFLYSC